MTNDIDNQEEFVRWAYMIQWTALVLPPTLALSLIYLLLIRGRVTNSELRSHVNWQLMTCGLIVAMIPIGLILFFVGMSGVNTDAPISIMSTFALVGALALFLPWLVYRLLRGTIRFRKQVPMVTLLP